METHQGAGCLSYQEGGKGADNRGAGSYIGNKVEKLPDGAKVKIVVK